MTYFKCDRCGGVEENVSPFMVVDIRAGGVIMERWELCEQCYATIKEVLQDGEIT